MAMISTIVTSQLIPQNRHHQRRHQSRHLPRRGDDITDHARAASAWKRCYPPRSLKIRWRIECFRQKPVCATFQKTQSLAGSFHRVYAKDLRNMFTRDVYKLGEAQRPWSTGTFTVVRRVDLGTEWNACDGVGGYRAQRCGLG